MKDPNESKCLKSHNQKDSHICARGSKESLISLNVFRITDKTVKF